MNRTIVRVLPDNGNWKVTVDGSPSSNHYFKDSAIEAGKKIAKQNEPSQLVVHKADGTIEYEYTYGSDPHPPKG